VQRAARVQQRSSAVGVRVNPNSVKPGVTMNGQGGLDRRNGVSGYVRKGKKKAPERFQGVYSCVRGAFVEFSS